MLNIGLHFTQDTASHSLQTAPTSLSWKACCEQLKKQIRKRYRLNILPPDEWLAQRIQTLPLAMPRAAIYRHVQQQAHAWFGEPAEQLNIDYQLLGERQRHQPTQIYVCAIRKTHLQTLLRVCDAAQLPIHRVSTSFVALQKLARQRIHTEHDCVAITHRSKHRQYFLVLQKQQPIFYWHDATQPDQYEAFLQRAWHLFNDQHLLNIEAISCSGDWVDSVGTSKPEPADWLSYGASL